MIALGQMLLVNTTLEDLGLHNSKIEDDGMAYLSFALQSNNSLKILNLRVNFFGLKGVLYLTSVIKSNKKIENLDLHFNEIGEEGLQELNQALEKNSTLRIMDCSASVDLNSIAYKNLEHKLEENSRSEDKQDTKIVKVKL
ncbi:MAG: hypothetical protein ACKOAD_07865 [Gammaproteobacteria bacterium]